MYPSESTYNPSALNVDASAEYPSGVEDMAFFADSAAADADEAAFVSEVFALVSEVFAFVSEVLAADALSDALLADVLAEF